MSTVFPKFGSRGGGGLLLIGNSRRGDHFGGGVEMHALIVEEDVRTEGAKHLALGDPTEEERLVDTDVPGAQGADHALVRGGVASGDEGGADRHILIGEAALHER